MNREKNRVTQTTTESPQETASLAKALAKTAAPGDVICLSGDLGVGKTVFAKGFAQGLNIYEEVTSPTFTIINEYVSGDIPLYHFDCYRLSDSGDAVCFDFEEYFEGEGVCLIEWAENIKLIIPDKARHITIRQVSDNKRTITY